MFCGSQVICRCDLTFLSTVLADFLSLSDTFDEHSLLRHQEADTSISASKEHSTNRSRIMSNVIYAPPEYVVLTEIHLYSGAFYEICLTRAILFQQRHDKCFSDLHVYD